MGHYCKLTAKGVLASLLLTFAVSSQGAIIDHGDYTSDTTTGLDWLDLSFGQNMSYDTFLTTSLSSTWRLATTAEVITFFGNVTNNSAFDPNSPPAQGESTSIDGSFDQVVQYTGFTNESYNGIYMLGFSDGGGASSGVVDQVTLGTKKPIYDSAGTDFFWIGSAGTYYTDSRQSLWLVKSGAVPAPATLALFAAGLIGLIASRRRKVMA